MSTPSAARELLDSCEEYSRFEREFCEVTQVTEGHFCTAFRARHKIDGQLYAIKRQTAEQEAELQDIVTLASLVAEGPGCSNLVRYFSAWLEDGLLYVQTELCEGSLRDHIASRRTMWQRQVSPLQELTEPQLEIDTRFSETELVAVLRDVAAGLTVLHGHSIMHLDLSPDNIFVHKGCFKISGLGFTARLKSAKRGLTNLDVRPSRLSQTGDAMMSCGAAADRRYVSLELLEGRLADLPKADVFSLGLVCYELARNPWSLPSDGDEWQDLRRGCLNLGSVQQMPKMLILLLCSMVSVDPDERPSSKTICRTLDANRPEMPMAVEHPAPQEGALNSPAPQQSEAPKDVEIRRLRAALLQAEEEEEHSRQRAEQYKQEVQRLRDRQSLKQRQSSKMLLVESSGDQARKCSSARTTSCPLKAPRFRACVV